jgi:hypothetical protein
MFSTGAVPVKDFLGCKVTTAKANWYHLFPSQERDRYVVPLV